MIDNTEREGLVEETTEENCKKLTLNESPDEAAEREYLSLVSTSNNDVMLRVAKKILEGQTEKGISESRDVVKGICDLTMRRFLSRVQHLYF